MKSVKQIVLDGLKYFREALLSDQYSTSAASTDTKHALSLKGAYDMYTELNSKKTIIRRYSGTVNGDILTVSHNLNISGTYYPLVSIGEENAHALLCYGVNSVGKNSFQVKLAQMDGYNIASANNYTVIIYWTY